MREQAAIAAAIPALNEAQSIGRVIGAIPKWVDDIVVVDNGSIDATASVARICGARVVSEPSRGYGTACLAGIAALSDPDVVVFLDADFSDHPEEMPSLVDPIVAGRADLVIGSRTLGRSEAGALTPQARFGNWLSCALIRLIWRVGYTDLGPFRAVRSTALASLAMRDRDYGWTVEMQVKAAARVDVRAIEVPVSYRKRIGKSKISGTLRGIVGAGTKILGTILLAAIEGSQRVRGRLMVFTRYPSPGNTKTRMIPALGAEGAAELQRRLTEHTMGQVRRLRERHNMDICVLFAGGDGARMREWLGRDVSYAPQGEGDLGERMRQAFCQAFDGGLPRAVIIGTDCPGLTATVMQRAFEALRHSDVVFGPARDGGYYLIGLRRLAPELFDAIDWGTESVLQQSLEAAERRGRAMMLLDPLYDVDRPGDLPVWEKVVARDRTEQRGTRISVIVPALNEADCIAASLESAQAGANVELIVVDGGSDDETRDIARARGAWVIESRQGRGCQMNAGAAEATGDVLLFLHADTCLPPGFDLHVREALASRWVVGGAFEVSIDGPTTALRLVQWGMNWRSRYARLPYGDQGIFVRADVFRKMGGFPDIAIMEDYELVRRLRRRGHFALVPARVTTSGRRWRTLGAWRATLLNQAVIAGYHLGVDPSHIATWYRGGRLLGALRGLSR